MTRLFTIQVGFDELFQRTGFRVCIVEVFEKTVDPSLGTILDPPPFIMHFLEPALLDDPAEFDRRLETETDPRLDTEGVGIHLDDSNTHYDCARVTIMSGDEFEKDEDVVSDSVQWLSWREVLEMNAETWQRNPPNDDDELE